jgi:trimethylamine--corrinoid protein Co-methyltransferase
MPDQPELLRPSDDAAAALRSRPRRERRTGGGIPRLPWRRVVNPFSPVEILSADQVDASHDAGLRILRDVGVEVLGARAIDLLEHAGARVERAGDAAGRGAAARVRVEPAHVTDLLGLAPARAGFVDTAPAGSNGRVPGQPAPWPS